MRLVLPLPSRMFIMPVFTGMTKEQKVHELVTLKPHITYDKAMEAFNALENLVLQEN